MSRLFAELYLDEDVDVLIADLVRARSFITLTARDAKQLGREDEDHLAFATAHGMVMVTHNRVDFESLATDYFNAGRSHSGIIIAAHRSPYELARRLFNLLNNVTADEFYNNIRYI